MKLRLRWICFAVAFVLVMSVYTLSDVGPSYAVLPSFEKLKLAGFPITFSAETSGKPFPPAGISGTPGISLSVGELDFGQVQVGSRSKEFIVTLTNTGTAPLKIKELQLPSPQFTMTRSPILPARIGPGVWVKLNVAFEAANPGTALSTIAVVTNAPKERVEIPVRAEAIGGGLPFSTQMAKVAEKDPSEKHRLARSRARAQVLPVVSWQKPKKLTNRSPRRRFTKLLSNKRSGANRSQRPRSVNVVSTQHTSPGETRPVVKVTEPGSSVELGPVTTVRWTANSPTGEPLHFNLYFQNPSFRLPLAVGLVENSVEVSLARIAIPELTGQFVVQANDGRNIIEATSPEVRIRYDGGTIGDPSLKSNPTLERDRVTPTEVISGAMSRVKIVSPSEGEIVSGMIAVRAELQEGLELDSVFLGIDGQKHQAGVFQSGLKLEVPFDTKHLSDGRHKLSLELVEKTGSKSSSTVTVLVSNGTLSRR